MYLNRQRAVEIVDSYGVIDVQYKGTPVWIEDISNENDNVKVKNLSTEEDITVNVSELEEV